MDKLYEIHDEQGLIADAKSEGEALVIFEEIRDRVGDYKNFDWYGDLKLVEVICTTR